MRWGSGCGVLQEEVSARISVLISTTNETLDNLSSSRSISRSVLYHAQLYLSFSIPLLSSRFYLRAAFVVLVIAV